MTINGRLLRLAGAAVLAAATTTTTLAGSASATVPSWQVLEASSLNNSDEYKGATTANCPTGTSVVGTGATDTGAGQVRLDDLIPSQDHVYAFGWEDENGTPNNWTVKARAICADLDGYEIISHTSTHDSVSPKSATADCTPGKQLVGTGWSIAGGDGEVGVTQVLPSTNYLYVKAYEDDNGTSNRWDVTAYAICAYAPSGWHIVSSNTTDSSNTAQAKSQTCPVGEVILGAGFNVVGEGDDIVPTSLWPGGYYAGQYLVTASASEDDDGTTSIWHMGVHAICATA
jgi:hypothetical protein